MATIKLNASSTSTYDWSLGQWNNVNPTSSPSISKQQKKMYPKFNPLKPPIYWIGCTDLNGLGLNEAGQLHLWPDEIIKSCSENLVHTLFGAYYKNNKELLYTRFPNLLYDYEEFIKDNPFVDFFAKSEMNFRHGQTWNAHFQQWYKSVYGSYNTLWNSNAGISQFNYHEFIPKGTPFTEIPPVPQEYKRETLVGSYRNLMREYPFTVKPTWRNRTEPPFWWLYDEWDDIIPDKTVYKLINGR